MTTVINFNFLNFFNLKLANRSVNINNDARSYNQYFDNRSPNYSPEREEVIDITPNSAELAVNDNGSEIKMIDTHRTSDHLNASGTHKIYDRKGKTIQTFQEKGVLFNSYA